MNFVRSSLKYPQVTITILAITFAVGINSLLHMPRREDPKITIRQGLVIAYYPGANSVQVEDQVTEKVEQYLFQFEEVRKEKTYSTTRDGAVVVNVELEESVKRPDIFWNKLKHELLLAKQLDLPQGVIGPIVNTEFGDTKALVIGIESEQGDYAQLKNHITKLEDALRTIQAVSKIKRIGEQKEQVVISSSSEKLAQYDIPLKQVVSVLRSQNAINATGSVKTGQLEVPLYTTGYYTTEDEIANQIIGTSDNGDVVRVKDVAKVKRIYEEPTSKSYINGKNAMMLAVEMHAGNNIVEFGDNVQDKLAAFQEQLPTGYSLTTIVDQPGIVSKNISHFFHEFFLAIISVVIVVILLMPFRIAAVAATAIPMTVAVTFALLHAFGIELHQVSLAALIVVLGMVVDDAIVVADNYVELLDKGLDRWTAAWRSASDLVVPVLTATVTIIAAFLPMVILTGSVGEFIYALPVTVAISLTASFIVSMVLTPLLCYKFIKKGLHNPEKAAKKKKPSVLDGMQNAYDRSLEWAMKHPRFTIWGSLLSIVLAGVLYITIDQKFFPAAERNQFVVELWMPSGTQLEETEKAMNSLENLVRNDERVIDYTSFVGSSAPRFYYNFSPEFPVSNYGQVLVNTTDEHTAEALATSLNEQLTDILPQARVEAKLMQQGTPTKSPVEIRIVGSDLNTLKTIGNKVESIMRSARGSRLVHNNFTEDVYGVSIQLSNEASRLGFTTGSVAQVIYTGFNGAPITTMYEGETPVDIVLRLEEEERQNFEDIKDTYLPSPATGEPVPLRQIATLTPQWHTGRIMHRNGLRTLTVGSQTTDDVLPSELLKSIKPAIDELELPHGYHLEIGGEQENKKETFSQMIVALSISLVAIFLILLLQFKNLKEASIVMFSIPLSLFGALAGLHLTGNNFGFTAFVGLISLSGIVVRNAIILVDYTNELLEKGMDIPTAAMEAGKRRLRPIFLTATAAAIGVVPMIVSGSPMWGPLASVIAVGVLFSMVMSLVAVPVMYVRWMKPSDKQHNEVTSSGQSKVIASSALLIVLFLASGSVKSQELINLQTATDSALVNNHLLTIKELQLQEKQLKVKEDKVNFFPKVNVIGGYLYNANLPSLTIPQGALGILPMGQQNVPLPDVAKTYEIGEHNVYNIGVMAYQPLTQIPRIKMGVAIAETEVSIINEEKKQAILALKQGVEKLYFGILITQKQQEERKALIASKKAKLKEVEDAYSAGKTIAINKAGLIADIASEQQQLFQLTIKLENYQDDFRHLTGIQSADSLKLAALNFSDSETLQEQPTYWEQANEANHELRIARYKQEKATYALKAAKRAYIPSIGVVGGYFTQQGVSLLPDNMPFAGLSLQWNIQDIFSNNYVVKQRKLIQSQAQENFDNQQETLSVELAKAHRNAKQAIELISVAEKVVHYRKEAFEIAQDRKENGLGTDTQLMEAKADLSKAEADVYAAQLSYRMAITDLQMLLGEDFN